MDHFVVKGRELGIATVLDVGANKGQFGQELRVAGYLGHLVSFEPLASCHAVLQDVAKADPAWTVAPPTALGAEDGAAEINVSENLVSSSLLPISSISVTTHPPTQYIGKQQVSVRRLDHLRSESWRPPFALKVDTQGFELEVLKGATETLRETGLVLLEMSLVPLYEGAAGFAELYAWMEKAGYRCIGITQGFSNLQRNEQLQADALFVRN